MLSQKEEYLLVNYAYKKGAEIYKFYDYMKEKVDRHGRILYGFRNQIGDI